MSSTVLCRAIQELQNFYNLSKFSNEFGVSAEWNFFATSHGKSPCDGLGGTIKHLTAQESLKRPFRNQILTVESMLEFCAEKIKNINFKFIGQTQLNEKRDEHKDRYDGVVTLPGTRSFHQFVHIRDNQVGAKRCSTDLNFALLHNMKRTANSLV